MNQELLMHASVLERQTQEIEQNLEYLESSLSDLRGLKEGLSYLAESKEKEVLSPIGGGMFMKSFLSDSKVFVQVGAGVVITKTMKEAEKTIEEQMKKLMEARIQLTAKKEQIFERLYSMIKEIEGSESE